jgi:hypothetical protein
MATRWRSPPDRRVPRWPTRGVQAVTHTGVQFRLMLRVWFRVMVDISLAGHGSFGPVRSVGSELDHLLGVVAWHGADELASEEHLEQGRVQSDGDDLAGEVSAG